MKLETFSLDIDADGIAVATFDVPGRSMNTLTATMPSENTSWAAPSDLPPRPPSRPSDTLAYPGGSFATTHPVSASTTLPVRGRLTCQSGGDTGQVGFAAIAAYGGFFIPKSYGTSIAMTGAPDAALYCFIAFYATCVVTTWWFYARKNAEMPC